MAISRKRIAASIALMNDPKWVADVLERSELVRADPVSNSTLAYWLKLDAWTHNEGMLILGGIDPQSIVREEHPEGFPCLVPHLWEFDTAQPFTQPPDFTLEPYGDLSRETYTGDDESFESLLERIEEVNAILDGHRKTISVLCHVLDRSAVGLGDKRGTNKGREALYGPEQFLAWAQSIRYTVPWLEWAKSKALLPGETGPFSAPFFDADAADYPELLAIAVRAWQHARATTKGTPKRRVLDYLEGAYPTMPQGSRDAIAQVVNWQRAGGRPAKKSS